MHVQTLTAYCLRKKGAYMDYPFGNIPACIKVQGKIFAEIYPLKEDCKITLKCEPSLADFLRRQYPGIVVRGYHCPQSQQPHRNTVYIEQIPMEELFSMIDHSYIETVKSLPKKVQRAMTEKEDGVNFF